MRSTVLVLLLLSIIGCALSLVHGSDSALEPAQSVFDSPVLEDLSLLQLSSEDHHQEQEDAEQEDNAEHQQLAQDDAEDEAESEESSSLDSDSADELEAELEAEAEMEVDAETDSEDSDELTAQQEEAQQPLEAKEVPKPLASTPPIGVKLPAPSASLDSTHSSLAETHSESTAEVHTEAAQQTGRPYQVHRVPAPVEQEAWRFRMIPHSKLQVSRPNDDPNHAPSVVELPNGKKLFKSWIVDPNLRASPPVKSAAKRHSKERPLTKKKAAKLARFASLKDPKRKTSSIRKQFLKLNPKIAKAERKKKNNKLKSKNLSPIHSFLRALRKGRFNGLKFDPPTSSTTTTVHQHLVVHRGTPSVRRRAEKAALKAAKTTLRRINRKRRDYKQALKALKQAKLSVQNQIHRHHVVRAIKAKKRAKKAARKAAWSALLQHKRLKKKLFKQIAKALRKGKLTGEARRQSIAALIKQSISPQERARLHAFINGHLRASRHHARRSRRHRRRALRKAAKRLAHRAKAILDRKQKKAIKAAQKAAKKAARKLARAARAARKAAAAQAKKVTPITSKDKKAIAALVERIKKAASAKAAAQTIVAPKKAVSRFAQVEHLLRDADSVEQSALHELNVETEVDSEVDQALQTDAEVEAEAEVVDDFLNQAEQEQEDLQE